MSIFYLDCELSRGELSTPAKVDQAYLVPCPVWCYGDYRTKGATLDFTNQINVNTSLAFADGDDLTQDQTFLDTRGNEWYFEPEGTAIIGGYLTGGPCGDIIFINNNLGGSLTLKPKRLASCKENPVINFSFPWTYLFKGAVRSGTFSMNAGPGSAPSVDGIACGPNNLSVRLQKTIVANRSESEIKWDDACGIERTLPPIKWEPNGDAVGEIPASCFLFGLSFCPCDNKIIMAAKQSEPTASHIWFPQPDDANPYIAPAQTQSFEIDCDDWHVIQRAKGYDGSFRPPAVLQYFYRNQSFSFGFGAGTSGIDLHKIRWYEGCADDAAELLTILGGL